MSNSPFVEAHQFKGVTADPQRVAMSHQPGISPELAEELRRSPPLSRDVSVWFSDGIEFPIQTGDAGVQYLLLNAQDYPNRVRVYVGEWVCKLPSGRFIKLTDQEFRDMGGIESPHVPAFPPYSPSIKYR